MSQELGPKDPQGYYVVQVPSCLREVVEKFDGVLIEQLGDQLLVRTKSRRIALKILKLAKKHGSGSH